MDSYRDGPFVGLGYMLEKQLTTLILKDNGLGTSGIAKLGQQLVKGENLAVLMLDKNQIGDSGVKILTASLGGTVLEYLGLASNNITAKGITVLVNDYIKLKVPNKTPPADTLKFLALCNNPLKDDGAKALSSGVRACSVLKGLMIRNCEISDNGIKELFALSTEASTNDKGLLELTGLWLNGNPITDASILILEHIIPQLRLLSLNRTKLSHEGIKTLCAILSKKPKPSSPNYGSSTDADISSNDPSKAISLSLQDIPLTLPSFVELFKACIDPRIEALNLGNTELTDAVLHALVPEIPSLHNVPETLILGGNPISDSGIEEFFGSLGKKKIDPKKEDVRRGYTLRNLYLDAIPLGVASLETLQNLVSTLNREEVTALKMLSLEKTYPHYDAIMYYAIKQNNCVKLGSENDVMFFDEICGIAEDENNKVARLGMSVDVKLLEKMEDAMKPLKITFCY